MDFLVFVKPDAVRRNLTGDILSRFERRGFVLRNIKRVQPTRAQAEEHYAEHKSRPFFTGLVDFTTSGPIVLMHFHGNIACARALIGTTSPSSAMPGTVRGDLANGTPDNVVHCSDSPESAERELALWFG